MANLKQTSVLGGVGGLQRRLGIGHLDQTEVGIPLLPRVALRFFTGGAGCYDVTIINGEGSPAPWSQSHQQVLDRSCNVVALERIRLARVGNGRRWIAGRERIGQSLVEHFL